MADVPKTVTDHLQALKGAHKNLDGLLKALKKAGDAPLLRDGAIRIFHSGHSGRAGRAGHTAADTASGQEAVAAWIADLEQALAGPAADAQATFGASLEDGLRAVDLPLRGRWPEWMCGPFRILARPERGEAELSWGPGAEPLEAAPLDTAAILDRIPKIAAELKARHAPDALPGRLLRAWRMALAVEDRTDGDVPLGALVPLVALQAQGLRFAQNPSRAAWTVPYGRVQFSYDLARLRGMEHDGMALRLRVATRDQTRRRGPLWLPDDAVGGGTLFATARFERRHR